MPSSFRNKLASLLTLAVLGASPGCRNQGGNDPGLHDAREPVRSVRLVATTTIGADTEGQPLLASVSSLYATADGLYVVDSASSVVNVYSHGGEFVRTIGRSGQGPGEYDWPNGVVASADETMVLDKNGRYGRIQLFDKFGSYKRQVRFRSRSVGGRPFLLDDLGDIYVGVSLPPEGDQEFSRGYAVIASNGQVSDPRWLTPPRGEPDRDWRLTVNQGREEMWAVPYAPTFEWAVGPRGVTATGITSEYLVTIWTQDGRSLQISRDLPRVPLTDEERAFYRAETTEDFRRWFAAWEWEGAEIPDEKPAFSDILIAQTGEIWILRAGPGEITDCPSFTFIDDWNSSCWRDRMFADIFSPDGSFRGEVALPAEVDSFYVAFLSSEFVLSRVETPDGNFVVKKYALRFEEPDSPNGSMGKMWLCSDFTRSI